MSATCPLVSLFAIEAGEECYEPFGLLERTDGQGCGAFVVHEVRTGQRLVGPVELPFRAGHIAIDGGGYHVAATGGFDGDLAVYGTEAGELVGTVPGPPRPSEVWDFFDVAGVGFGPDGRIFAGSMAGPIRVVDTTDASLIRTIEAGRTRATCMSWSATTGYGDGGPERSRHRYLHGYGPLDAGPPG